MNPTQVRAAETSGLLSEGEESLTFQGEMVGQQCIIRYEFSNQRLTSGSYYFNEHDDRMDAVVYTRLQESLNKKYGDGDEDYHWRNPLRRVDISTVGDLGVAVAAGHLTAITSWKTPDTSIVLALDDKKDKYDAHVLLIYRDLNAPEGEGNEADLDLL